MDSKRKYEIIEKVIKIDDEAVLNQVNEILEFDQHAFWTGINPDLRASLQRGMDQANRGEGVPHEEFIKTVRYKSN